MITCIFLFLKNNIVIDVIHPFKVYKSARHLFLHPSQTFRGKLSKEDWGTERLEHKTVSPSRGQKPRSTRGLSLKHRHNLKIQH